MMQQGHPAPTPLWRITRWLVDPGHDVPAAIRASLVNGLYGTLPIFAGGVINTVAVAAAISYRLPHTAFLIWLALEASICLVRLFVLLKARKRNFIGVERLTDIYIGLGVLWAGSVGYGTYISVASGDWVAGALAWLSAAAMVGGICFRNFGAPRLVGVMILLSLGPCVVASLMSGEPILYLTAFQIPFYLYAMTVAAFRLNKMLITTMRAEQENDHLARHDLLTGLLNRTGLERQLNEAAMQPGTALTLFYLDLDGFKGVNDRLGHAAGDELLAMVGRRLHALSRQNMVMARIGGDEFIMASGGGNRADALALGEEAIAAIAGQPYLLGQEAVEIGVSIGIAFAPVHGSTLPELMSAADNALYQAKSRGRCTLATATTTAQPHLRLAKA
jgi:diguanylate cyclase (GGDEF)-like protein